jgi:hypothetical protein
MKEPTSPPDPADGLASLEDAVLLSPARHASSFEVEHPDHYQPKGVLPAV